MYVVTLLVGDTGIPDLDGGRQVRVVGAYLTFKQARSEAYLAAYRAMDGLLSYPDVGEDVMRRVVDTMILEQRIVADICYVKVGSQERAVELGNYAAARDQPRWAEYESPVMGHLLERPSVVPADIPADVREAVTALLRGDPQMSDALRDVLAGRK